MTRVVFAIPGDITTRTGGYIYDRRVMELLPESSVNVQHLQLPGSFPYPGAVDLQETRRLLAAVAAADVLIIDGLAWGAVTPDIIRAVKAKIIALCHHPLGLEAGLTAAQSAAFIANERVALAAAAHVIVTSATTAATLIADFDVPRGKITIAEPGTERAGRAHGGKGVPVLAAVGSIVPRKGYDVLVDALSSLKDRQWRLVIAGSPHRAPEHAKGILQKIAEAKLENNIQLTGELDDAALAEVYASADIFISSSHYEGYGMVLTEALVRGLPIITTTGGAAAETVPDGTALKVPPGDAAALAQAIERLLTDTSLRRELADNAWAASAHLPRWQDTAGIIAKLIRTAATDHKEIKT